MRLVWSPDLLCVAWDVPRSWINGIKVTSSDQHEKQLRKTSIHVWFVPPPPSPTLVPSHPRILSACDLDDIHRYHTQHCAWALHTKYLCPPAAVFALQAGLRTFSLSRRPARIYYRIKLLPERHFVLKGRWIEFVKHFLKNKISRHAPCPIYHKRSCGES